MQAAARVSEVMPFFNAQQFIGEATESVRAQTYADWELLLIDDGSTDGSTEIAHRYAEQHPERIRYLAHPGRENLGPGAARNLGLARARGEYVALLDADDLAHPRRLEKQVAVLDARPGVAALGSWYTEVDSTGRSLRRGKTPCDHLDIRWALLFYSPFVHSTVMLRKDAVLERVGGYDEALRTSQDYELWTRISRCLGTASLPEYLVSLRLHETSLTATSGAKAAIGHRMRVEAVSRLLGWERSGFACNESRLLAMSRLLVGTAGGHTPEAPEAAVDEILRLHAAFCKTCELSSVEARAHRLQVQKEVSANLLALGLATGSRALLARAYRLYPRVLRDPRVLLRSSARGLRQLVSDRGR